MPPALARRSSSNTSPGAAVGNQRPRPSRPARSTSISRSVRTFGGRVRAPGGAAPRALRGWSSCRPLPPTARWAARRRRAPRSPTGRSRRRRAGRATARRSLNPLARQARRPARWSRPPAARARRRRDRAYRAARRPTSRARGSTISGTSQTAAMWRRAVRVVDPPVAGKLVGLLAVLAPALPVSLTGDGPVAAEAAARPVRARARC